MPLAKPGKGRQHPARLYELVQQRYELLQELRHGKVVIVYGVGRAGIQDATNASIIQPEPPL